MTPAFKRAGAWVLDQEKGPYGDGWARSGSAHDHGGETRYGISKRWHPTVDLETLTPMGALDIYFEEIWQPLGLERAALPLGLALLDEGVHGGSDDAVRSLQRALEAGLIVDGRMGRKTREALERTKKDPLELAQRCVAERIEQLVERILLDPDQALFPGWWVRIVRLSGEVRTLA